MVKNKIQESDGDPRHNTVNGYKNHGCRCEGCKAAWTTWIKAYRIRKRAQNRELKRWMKQYKLK